MSDEKDHVIVVQEAMDTADNLIWMPRQRCASVKDAQTWLRKSADPGTYHILSFRYESVTVQVPEPKPPTNEVNFGRQHLRRGEVPEDRHDAVEDL